MGCGVGVGGVGGGGGGGGCKLRHYTNFFSHHLEVEGSLLGAILGYFWYFFMKFYTDVFCITLALLH